MFQNYILNSMKSPYYTYRFKRLSSLFNFSFILNFKSVVIFACTQPKTKRPVTLEKVSQPHSARDRKINKLHKEETETNEVLFLMVKSGRKKLFGYHGQLL